MLLRVDKTTQKKNPFLALLLLLGIAVTSGFLLGLLAKAFTRLFMVGWGLL